MKSLDLLVFNIAHGEIPIDLETTEPYGVIKYLITKEKWKGWVIPVINNSSYRMHWSITGYEWESIRVQNDYLWPDDFKINLRFKHNGSAELFDIFYTGTEQKG